MGWPGSRSGRNEVGAEKAADYQELKWVGHNSREIQAGSGQGQASPAMADHKEKTTWKDLH